MYVQLSYPFISLWTSRLLPCPAKSLQSCPTLCDPTDSPVPGILQARTLEWVAISFSNAWKWKVKVKSLSHVRLSDPMDCGPPGSSVHGIFQARVLEWAAIAFSALSYSCSLSFCSFQTRKPHRLTSKPLTDNKRNHLWKENVIVTCIIWNKNFIWRYKSRWRSRRMCAHLLLQEHQNGN